MRISRLVVRNFRNFRNIDFKVSPGASCILGENNSGKSNLLYAIRLAMDAKLAPVARQLSTGDVFAGVDQSQPFQVVIAVEFTDFHGDIRAQAAVADWMVSRDCARITFRFRPRRSVLDDLNDGIRDAGDLSIEDYRGTLWGGGGTDPATIAWDADIAGGGHVRFGALSDLNVTVLPPLRDVTAALRKGRASPLRRLIAALDIDDAERNALIEAVAETNARIEEANPIRELGETIERRFLDTAGPAYAMGVSVGVAAADFNSVVGSLNIVLSNDRFSGFEPERNGLGLNNILYISMLLEEFHRRAEDEFGSAFDLLLFEEPEAHVHPELQGALFSALEGSSQQVLMTTHSTHITSRASLDSYVVLTANRGDGTSASTPDLLALTRRERRDIERYLDATRSRMLFAKGVLLVEGAAELHLVPAMTKAVLHIDLSAHGVVVVAINGTHFSQYTKLFSERGLRCKCAVLADGDGVPVDTVREDEPLDNGADQIGVEEHDRVRAFVCPVTFERAIVMPGTLPMLIGALEEAGSRTTLDLAQELKVICEDDGDVSEYVEDFVELRDGILRAATQDGKGRFSQRCAAYASEATVVPRYVEMAIQFLVNP